MIEVAVGGVGVLAVKADGTVWEAYGESPPAQVIELSGIVHVAAGIGHYMALKNDGTVWEWPGPWYAPVLPPPDFNRKPYQIDGVNEVVAIAAGETRSLAVKSDGTVWEWTRPTDGFGYVLAMEPRQVSGLDGVLAVSVAYEAWFYSLLDSRTVALKRDGTVFIWNVGEMAVSCVPTAELTGIVAITAGPAGELALKDDGTVWQWGSYLRPMHVNGLDGIVAVANGAAVFGYAPAPGGGHGLALKSDGTVWAWGDNSRGQLGNGTRSEAFSPVQVIGLSDVVKISAAGVYTSVFAPVSVAIKRDGTVWIWGETWNCQVCEEHDLP